MSKDTTSKITRFIEDHCLVEFEKDFNPNTHLFMSGIIDSFTYIELIKFIESEFELHLSDTDLVSEVLNTVSNISKFITDKQQVSA